MRGKLPALVALLALLAGTFAVQADEKVRCEVFTIEASNGGQGVDPALKEFAAIFRESPFSGFNTFRLVHRQTYEMPHSAPVKLTLPESLGGSLRLNGAEGRRLDLTLTLARKGQQPVNIQGRASPGSPFFAAGFKNSSGVWVFGVACARDDIANH